MHEAAALDAGEDLAVQGFGAALVGKDHAAARAAQRLVRRGGGDVGMGDGAGMQAGGHQTGDVGHVHQQDGPDLIGDGPENGRSRSCGGSAGPGHDGGRIVLPGKGARLRHSRCSRLLLHAVGYEGEQLAGEVHRAAVGEVPAMRKVHAQMVAPGSRQEK